MKIKVTSTNIKQAIKRINEYFKKWDMPAYNDGQRVQVFLDKIKYCKANEGGDLPIELYKNNIMIGNLFIWKKELEECDICFVVNEDEEDFELQVEPFDLCPDCRRKENN